MIECFNNLVGIRVECGDQIPSHSGFYIQDLPFLNLKLADALISDQSSGIQLLNDCYSRAVNYLVNDARTRMNPYFKRTSVIENNQVGYYPLQQTIISGVAGFYKGIQIQIRQFPYLDVFIPSMTLWVDYTGTIPVEVWNLTTGKLLDTISVDCVAGVQTLLPEMYKNYSNNGQTLNLFIGYNTTGINSYQANIYSSIIPNSYGSCITCLNAAPWSSWNRNKYTWLFSQQISASLPKIQTNLSSCNDTGGLSLTYTLNCSMDKWLCSMRNQYGYALLYRWGVEILKEATMSMRLNSLVVLKKEEKEALQMDFEATYEKSMGDAFRNVKLPNDVCFVCNQHLLTGVTMP